MLVQCDVKIWFRSTGQTHVCKLKKAPRAWYGKIDNFLMSLGFTKSKVDPNLYFKMENDGTVILLVYVDDLFLTDEENIITNCKKKLVVEFEIRT
jgi:hypothetical protein